MELVFFTLAVPICIADLYGHVIPNIYNRILFYASCVWITFFGIGNLVHVGISLMLLAFLLLMGVGMGDIKLLTLILVTHNFESSRFFIYIGLAAFVHILILLALKGTTPTRIPMAPSIFVAMATYLATS